jgi:hypothetical protein
MAVTMIAPDAPIGKWKRFAPTTTGGNSDIVSIMLHEFVNGIIILPNSGQPRAKLECE